MLGFTEEELDFTVTAAWSPVSGAAHYELRWKSVWGGGFTAPVTTWDTSHEIAGFSPGQYIVRIRAINEVGQMSVPSDRTVAVLTSADEVYWTTDSGDLQRMRTNLGGGIESVVTGLDNPAGIALSLVVDPTDG